MADPAKTSKSGQMTVRLLNETLSDHLRTIKNQTTTYAAQAEGIQSLIVSLKEDINTLAASFLDDKIKEIYSENIGAINNALEGVVDSDVRNLRKFRDDMLNVRTQAMIELNAAIGKSTSPYAFEKLQVIVEKDFRTADSEYKAAEKALAKAQEELDAWSFTPEFKVDVFNRKLIASGGKPMSEENRDYYKKGFWGGSFKGEDYKKFWQFLEENGLENRIDSIFSAVKRHTEKTDTLTKALDDAQKAHDAAKAKYDDLQKNVDLVKTYEGRIASDESIVKKVIDKLLPTFQNPIFVEALMHDFDDVVLKKIIPLQAKVSLLERLSNGLSQKAEYIGTYSKPLADMLETLQQVTDSQALPISLTAADIQKSFDATEQEGKWYLTASHEAMLRTKNHQISPETISFKNESDLLLFNVIMMGGPHRKAENNTLAKPIANAALVLDLLGITKDAPSYAFISPSAFEFDKTNTTYLKKQGIVEYSPGDMIARRKGVLFDLESSINAVIITLLPAKETPVALVEASPPAKKTTGPRKSEARVPSTKVTDIEPGDWIDGKGFYVTTWESAPGYMRLPQKFNVFAAREDLGLMGTFNTAAKLVGDIKDMHGHDGIEIYTQDDLEKLIETGQYKGEWFIPTVEMLDGNGLTTMLPKCKSSLLGLATLNKIDGLGSAAQYARITDYSYPHIYWSCSKINDSRMAVDFKNKSRGAVPSHDKTVKLSTRPVRLEPVKPPKQ